MSPALPTNDVVLMVIPGSHHVSRVRRWSCSACRQSRCGPVAMLLPAPIAWTGTKRARRRRVYPIAAERTSVETVNGYQRHRLAS